jgi:phosphoribosyl-AMP cyclohydrolase
VTEGLRNVAAAALQLAVIARRKCHRIEPSMTDSMTAFLDEVAFGADGLVPTIAQQHDSGEVLMLAWMNREALRETVATGRACYWSRSRGQLWRKGETSGQVQRVVELRLDCDLDAVLLRVDQSGVACHTGRRSCFFNRIEKGRLVAADPVIADPAQLYPSKPAD